METKSWDSSKSRKFDSRGTIAVILNDNGLEVSPEVLRTLLLGIEREHPWVETIPGIERGNRLCVLKTGKKIAGVNGHVLEIQLSSNLHSGQVVAFCNYINTLAISMARIKLEGVKSVNGYVTFEVDMGDHYPAGEIPLSAEAS